MKTYLVTGGAGFIGSHVAQALSEGGAAVRVLDDLSTGREANLAGIGGRIELVRGDVRDRALVERAVRGADAVFHLAAQVSVARSVEKPDLTYDVNVGGTLVVLEAMRAAGARRIVLSSSCAVYGDSEVLPKTEDMQPEPISPYAGTKVAGEHLCAMYCRLHGLEAVSLRYFNVFGPRQDPASEYAAAVPRFLERMTAGERPAVHGDGRQTRDFVYVANVVDANLLAAGAAAAAGQALNIGSGRSISILDLVAEINAALGTALEPVHEGPRPGDVRHASGTIDRAKRQLGWSPRVGLGEGLALTARWLAGKKGR